MEAERPPLPPRDLLLRPRVLRALPRRPNAQSPGPQGHVVGGGGLGRPGSDCTQGAGRI